MKLRAAASVFAIAAAISACSSSSSGGGPASVAGGTTAGGGAPVTAPAGSASGGSSGDFCAKLTSANSKLGNLGSTAAGGDFGAIKTVIDQEVAAFQELGNGAPAAGEADDRRHRHLAADGGGRARRPRAPGSGQAPGTQHEGAGRREQADHLRHQQLQLIG